MSDDIRQLADDELIRTHQMLVEFFSMLDASDERRPRVVGMIAEVEDELYRRVGRKPGRHLYAVPDEDREVR